MEAEQEEPPYKVTHSTHVDEEGNTVPTFSLSLTGIEGNTLVLDMTEQEARKLRRGLEAASAVATVAQSMSGNRENRTLKDGGKASGYEEGGNMTEQDKGQESLPPMSIEEWEAKREWEERIRALAAEALGVDTESSAYRQVANLTEELAETELTRSPKEQHELMRRARAAVNFLQGSTPTATPELSVWEAPSIVHKTASLMRHPSRADLTAPIHLERPLQWLDGQTGPPVWEADPWLVLAEPVALRWLQETGGTVNPHYPGNKERLRELVTEHLEAFRALWPDVLEAPDPVDAAPLISNTKLAREPEAVEEGTLVGAGKHRRLAHIRATQIVTRRIDGKEVRYTALHGAIGDAITATVLDRIEGAKWGEGVPVSNREIARHLLQSKRDITSTQVGEVEGAIADLRMTHGLIVGTDYEGNSMKLDGPLLHADYVYLKHRNGAEVTGWKVYALPLMSQYAGRLNQLRQVDNMLEGSNPRRLKRAALERQIAATILLWHGTEFKGPEHAHKLNYDTAIEKLGEAKEQGGPLSRDLVRTRQQWIEEALTHFQGRGFITRWEPYYTGRKKTGVHVWLPEKLPPASLREFRPLELLE